MVSASPSFIFLQAHTMQLSESVQADTLTEAMLQYGWMQQVHIETSVAQTLRKSSKVRPSARMLPTGDASASVCCKNGVDAGSAPRAAISVNEVPAELLQLLNILSHSNAKYSGAQARQGRDVSSTTISAT